MNTLCHYFFDRLGRYLPDKTANVSPGSDHYFVLRLISQPVDRIDHFLWIVDRGDWPNRMTEVCTGVLKERSVHGGRHHCAHADRFFMIGFELLSQALIQPTQAMFRRSVRGRVSRAGNAGHGCDVDKNPLPATLKFPHRHPGAVDCTKQIRSYNLFMFCNGGICETAKRSHPGAIPSGALLHSSDTPEFIRTA